MIKRALRVFILICFLVPLSSLQAVEVTVLPQELVKNGGYIVSQNGQIVSQYRENELFRPASTIKLLTSLAVLDVLGENYRHQTSFYLDGQKRLFVKGSGDPFLTSEYLSQIVAELKQNGLKTISGYVLDDTVFMLEHYLPDGSENSLNPYDAPNGGLAINFNSISIIRQANGTIGSGEAQTPTTSIARGIGKKLPKGNHRVNINHYPLSGRLHPQLRYTAEVIHELALDAGIQSAPLIRKGIVPEKLEPIFIFTSPRTVRDNIRSCLFYSNNFIANQLALTAGAYRYGFPATWEKSRRLLRDYAANKLHIPATSIRVEEASGLSRKNSATPQAMLSLLDDFLPYRNLLPRKNGALVKTGTMKSTYCYAGYFDEQGAITSFAILLNQKQNSRSQLLISLKKHLPAN
ncbi:D-alanyl-D-alanine carboxypeptidase/D-alanyl-D-alanine-endopeptidase [Desulfopila sp. IMCC35008]|uniref:D-alanyl-D-alanine carboxypeptidase/D-alanyl-D-alanine-endopeptidase n=1 Tax=Desulfopila sp. IMCC35008 TaxID=2653858 RepID=UPI0013D33582|nr:D-alanyl-D-alanine carboxypeptidase [Desulfopila sp. IMCC35008]